MFWRKIMGKDKRIISHIVVWHDEGFTAFPNRFGKKTLWNLKQISVYIHFKVRFISSQWP